MILFKASALGGLLCGTVALVFVEVLPAQPPSAPRQLSDVAIVAITTLLGIIISSTFSYMGLRSGQKATENKIEKKIEATEKKVDEGLQQNVKIIEKAVAIQTATDGNLTRLNQQIAVLVAEKKAYEEKAEAVAVERDRTTERRES